MFPLKSEVAGLLLIDRAKSLCDFEFRLFRRTGSANLTFLAKKAGNFLFFFRTAGEVGQPTKFDQSKEKSSEFLEVPVPEPEH